MMLDRDERLKQLKEKGAYGRSLVEEMEYQLLISDMPELDKELFDADE